MDMGDIERTNKVRWGVLILDSIVLLQVIMKDWDRLSDTNKTEVRGTLPLLSRACQQKTRTKPRDYPLISLTTLAGKRYTFKHMLTYPKVLIVRLTSQ